MTVPADQGFELTVIRGEVQRTVHVPREPNSGQLNCASVR